MKSRVRAALFALLVVLVTVGPVAAPAAAQPADQRAPATDAILPEEPGETTFRVRLLADGDARWTVTMNYSLTSTARQDAFEEVAATYATRRDSPTLSAFTRASTEASRATGREMAIRAVEFDSARYNDTGQLRLQFRWTNFSRQADNRLHVDDAFNTTDGTWLRSLEDHQRLVIVPADEYDSLVQASPTGYEVTNTALTWTGERTFAPGELSATYKRVRGPVDTGRELDLALFVIPGVIAGVAVVGYLVVTGDRGLPVPTGSGGSGGPEAGTTPSGPEEPGGSPDSAAPAGAAGAAGGAVDEELLSDEERVERLLERNGGRMKQANIVKETGWSNAKVSQLLSAMDEEGRIDKLRIGRENLISFPDEDVTGSHDES